MKFTKLVPNLFYTDIKVGIKLFIDCLEFETGYQDLQSAQPCFIAQKDDLEIFIFQNQEYAEKDRPEMRLQTNNIREVYQKVPSKFPELLHPNLNKVTLRPWGSEEFALRDESDVCVIIQQW